MLPWPLLLSLTCIYAHTHRPEVNNELSSDDKNSNTTNTTRVEDG